MKEKRQKDGAPTHHRPSSKNTGSETKRARAVTKGKQENLPEHKPYSASRESWGSKGRGGMSEPNPTVGTTRKTSISAQERRLETREKPGEWEKSQGHAGCPEARNR